MTDSLITLNKQREEHIQQFVAHLPDLAVSLKNTADLAYSEGALDAKTKRLIAMGIGLGVGCENCQIGQAMSALELGATKEEILETIAVVASIRGTTGIAESYKIIQLLEELAEV